MTSQEQIRPTYVVVLLGCKVAADGNPTPLLQARIDTAGKFYHERRKGPDSTDADASDVVIIATGGAVGNEHCEGAVMRAKLIEQWNVPEGDVILESEAVDTETNAKHAVTLMLTHPRLREACRLRAVLITSAFHVIRGGFIVAAVLRSTSAKAIRDKMDVSEGNGDVRTRGELAVINDEHRNVAGAAAMLEPLWEVVGAPDYLEGAALTQRRAWELKCIAEQLPGALAFAM